MSRILFYKIPRNTVHTQVVFPVTYVLNANLCQFLKETIITFVMYVRISRTWKERNVYCQEEENKKIRCKCKEKAINISSTNARSKCAFRSPHRLVAKGINQMKALIDS